MLPDLTSLQYLVLSALNEGEKSGSQLRDMLKANGLENYHGPKYYRLMSRMRDAVPPWVEAKPTPAVVPTIPGHTQEVIETNYTITDKGRQLLQETLDFYVSLAKKNGIEPTKSTWGSRSRNKSGHTRST